MQAHEIMTRTIITVSPDDSVQELARILTDGGISGAPVVDGAGNLVGVVSEADVISKRGRSVGEVMRQHVITVSPETAVEEVCDVMARNNINRVPVLQDGAVIGIIARSDVVRAIARGCLSPELGDIEAPSEQQSFAS